MKSNKNMYWHKKITLKGGKYMLMLSVPLLASFVAIKLFGQEVEIDLLPIVIALITIAVVTEIIQNSMEEDLLNYFRKKITKKTTRSTI